MSSTIKLGIVPGEIFTNIILQKMHLFLYFHAFGSSHSQAFYEIGVFENCAQFAGKHMRWNIIRLSMEYL